jgi:hypothetical protein
MILSLFLVATLFSLNTYAGKSVDWPGFAAGASSLAVMEGRIQSIDLEKMHIIFEKCELLGEGPLILSKDTECYIGDEMTNITSIRGGTDFLEKDRLNIEDLKAGDYIRCNYSKRDGKYKAVRIISIRPFISITGG